MASKSLFSCRIVDIGSYNATPVKDLDVCYSEFRSRAVEKVPIVRIFGSTPAGQKTCLHVHGIFPYIYVPCPVADPSSGYLQQLACSIDHGLQLSLGSRSDHHHVFKITVVKGIPMYGYHDNEELFLKIYLYNPSFVKRLSELLVAGVVMGTVLQPHEAHIPFVLQMMVDYNLYGMNYVHFSSVKFRSGRNTSVGERTQNSRGVSPSPPLLTPPSVSPPLLRHSSPSSPSPLNTSLVPTPSQQVWDADNLPRSMLVCVPRVSESELEVDAIDADIMNRQQIFLARGCYPGLASIWEEERQRRRQLGLTTTLTPPPSPDRLYDSSQPAELAATVETIVEERHSGSVSPMVSSPHSSDASVTMSCDTQSHRPIRLGSPDVARRLSLESSGEGEEGAKRKGAEPVVNEEAMHQAMELSQKFKIETLRKSTDEELLDLMLELVQTQVGMATQPSQSVYQTPTVIHRLCKRLTKSISVPTTSSSGHGGHSLPSLYQSQPLCDSSITGFTGLTGSQSDSTTGSVCSQAGVEAGEEVAAMQLQDVDKFLAVGEDLLGNSYENNSMSETVAVTTKTADIVSTRPTRDSALQEELADDLPHSLPVPLPQSPVFSDADLFDTDFPLDPPPSLPPSPPRDPAPEMDGTNSELECPDEKDLVQDSSVMLNSCTLAVEKINEDDELDGSSEFESPFDIPCGQRVPSQQSSNSPEGRDSVTDRSGETRDVVRNRDDRSSSSEGGRQSVEVQLEYEMPEISLSQFESSVTEILGTPSKMARGGTKMAPSGTKTASSGRKISSDGASSGTKNPSGYYTNVVSDSAKKDMSCRVFLDMERVNKELRGPPLDSSDASENYPPRGTEEMSLTQLQRRTSTPFRGGDDLSPAERGEDDIFVPSDASSTCLTSSQRRSLLQQLCCAGGDDGEVGDEVGEGGEGGVPESETEDEEDEREWRSGQWSTQPLTIPESPQKRQDSETCTDQLDGPIDRFDRNIQIDDCINQLDGTSDTPKTSRLRRKTLSIRRTSERQSMVKTVPDKPSVITDVREENTLSSPPEKRRKVLESSTTTDAASKESGGVMMESGSGGERVEDVGSGVNVECGSDGVMMECGNNGVMLECGEKAGSEVNMECISDGEMTECTGANMEDFGVSISQTEKMKKPSNKVAESSMVDTVTTTGTGDVDSGKNLRVGTQEPCDETKVGTEGKREKKSKLSLSLSSRKRHHRKNLLASTSPSSSKASSPLPVSSSPSLTRNNINSHPLAVQWKDRAIHNPPRVSLCKITHPKTKDGSTRRVSIDEESLTSLHSTPSSKGAPQRAKSRRGKTTMKRRTRVIRTRAKRTMFMGEEEALEWAIRESLGESSGKSNESISSQSSSDSLHVFSPDLCSQDMCDTSTTRGENDELPLRLSSDSEMVAEIAPSSASLRVTERGPDRDTLLSSNGGHTHRLSLTPGGGERILLEVVSDPQHTEEELLLSSACGAVGMETDVSPSETSSQGVESDFHLLITESDSESSEVVLPLHSVKRREEVDGCDGTGTEEQSLFHSDTEQRLSSYCTSTAPLQVEIPPTKTIIRPLRDPPSATRLTETATTYGLPSAVHKKPFYSNPSDVQPAREVNRRLVRILSTMPYELPEAEPPVFELGGKYATPLSSTGIHHWRTVLSMLNDISPSTETWLPPHPPRVPNHQQPHYTIEDHKRDVKLRSTFFPTKKPYILTPLQLPPHPLVVRKWLTATSERSESEEDSVTKTTIPSVTESETKETMSNERDSGAFTPVSMKRETSQLEGPSPQNTYGFKISQSAFSTSSDTHEYLTIMSVELHIRTRGSLRPNPEWDPVMTIFYYIHHDYPRSCAESKQDALGAIAIDIHNSGFQAVDITRQKTSPKKRTIRSPKKRTIRLPEKYPSVNSKRSGDQRGQSSQTLTPTPVAKGYLSGCMCGKDVTYVSSETELMEELVAIVRRHDPDILLGYEVTMMSWGYLIDRAASLNVNLTNQLSRIPHQTDNKSGSERAGSGTGTRHKASSSQVRIPGRIVLSVWKLMRNELALTSYSFENTHFQVMHQRIPMFSFQTLTQWYENGTHGNRAEVVEYYLLRCHGNYQLLEKLNLIGRTSEFARLYGIEFENVLTRGSQYRVESMLLRLAKPANYVAISPSVQQRARMAAPECLPLILEPESKFYSDPVLLLDFQSLYPSIVIGYNYCYTTCLGRVRNLALHGDYTLGTNSLSVPTCVLKKVKNSVTMSPNGVLFVTPNIRRGLMPRMLEEILGTRIMVKNSMKQHKADKALNRMLDARQMGLKLIANVTYGYTAASFSGRMPCVEVADSIVGKARETLERTIRLINGTAKWRARVVYGATDSVFVLLKGVSKEEAFRIGREICDCVTADNPKPVKLKFEKVYYPCILQTKNRYCGYMYETPDQMEPRYDAKGIETVRRDTCPAVAKILKKSLSLLFSTYDVSQVKSYVQRQARKLLDGHVSVQDYILAKEYRGRGNYRPGACVPALELARRATELDPRAEPRPGERVPYVVVYGHPGQPLIQLVRPPLDVVKDHTLRLNGVYYITKQVLPALDRALSLLGVDVYQWYNELPRVFRAPLPPLQETTNRKLKGTLGRYFATMHCPVCDELTTEGVCSRCRGNPQKVSTMLSQKIHDIESAHHSVTMLCHSCTRSTDPTYLTHCVSLDCPVFYRRLYTLHTLSTVTNLTKLLHTSLAQT